MEISTLVSTDMEIQTATDNISGKMEIPMLEFSRTASNTGKANGRKYEKMFRLSQYDGVEYDVYYEGEYGDDKKNGYGEF